MSWLIVLVSTMLTSTVVLVLAYLYCRKTKLSSGAGERRYKDLADSLPETVFEADAGGKITFANRNSLGAFGYSQEELAHGLNVLQMIAPADRTRAEENIRRLLSGEDPESNEYMALRKDGSTFPISVYSTAVKRGNETVGFRGIILDISERRRAEEALHRSEEKYRLLVETANEAIVVAQDNELRFVNPKASRITGYSYEELTTRPFLELIHPDDRAMVSDRYQQRLRGESLPEVYSFRVLGKDGNTRWVEISAVRILWEGRPATLNFLTDITERKQAEEALRESEARLRSMFEASPIGIELFDAEGKLVAANQADLRMYGIPDIASIKGFDLFQSADMPPGVHERLLAGQPVRYEAICDFDKIKRLHLFETIKSGQDYHEVQITPLISDERLRGYLVQIQDITERKRVEQQLLQAQKMETVGRLAGGIAHDFNNLLTAITGHASFAYDELPPGVQARDDIGHVLKAAERAAALTQQLLAFSRRQVIQAQVLNLNELILDVDKMLRRLVGEDIEFVTLPASELGLVKADPSQIQQVIANLVVNARDAMPNGGKLTIGTANVTLDEADTGHHVSVVPGDYVMLAVSDTGMGMSEEVKAHLFEPFYTTKEVGKGTGLGLATIYGIVMQHRGNIRVYSEPGQGTTFKVYLPRANGTAGQSLTRAEAGSLPRGTETILVAEDEPSVRSVAVRILRGLGYTVLETGNGDQALRVAQKHQGQIQLLLTDVVMPRMDGQELATRLRVVHPSIKVVFVSGYTEDGTIRRGVLEEGVAFLQKPFTALSLAQKVREVLDTE